MALFSILLQVQSVREAIHMLAFIAIGFNFLISGLVINLVQFSMWITIKPINVWLYRKLNYYCAYAVFGQLAFVCEWLSSSTCLIYTDEKTWNKLGTEHAIALTNHCYEVDFLFSYFLCEQLRNLGSLKSFLKKLLNKVPVLGWNCYFSEFAFVERNFDVDKVTIEKQVSCFGVNPDPVMFGLYAEGTRFTKAKHEASTEFSLKRGLKPLKHLLLPRTKGFILSLNMLRGKFPAVYCATLVFDTKQGAPPVFKSLILGRPMKAEVLIERIPIEDIPDDPDKASQWLYDNFDHKDKMIEIYKTEGMFPTSIPGHYFEGPITAHYRPRRLWTLLFIVLSSYFITLPLVMNCFLTLLASGTYGVTLSVFSLGIVVIVLFKLVDMTDSSKGSEYGLQKNN